MAAGRSVTRRLSVDLALGSLALVVSGLLAGPGLASTAASKPTVIHVIAGKPVETAFTLSRFSLLPAGKFVFRIRNAGQANHDFELCATPVRSSARNSCFGYQSRNLEPGQMTTITIAHIPRGRYEFLSTDSGDAAGGMKGLIGVEVAVKAPPVRKPAPTVDVSDGYPGVTAATATPPDTTPTPPPAAPPGSSGYICKQGQLIQGVSTPNLCQFPQSKN